eukprot:5980262-Amphidinium_carterae.2
MKHTSRNSEKNKDYIQHSIHDQAQQHLQRQLQERHHLLATIPTMTEDDVADEDEENCSNAELSEAQLLQIPMITIPRRTTRTSKTNLLQKLIDKDAELEVELLVPIELDKRKERWVQLQGATAPAELPPQPSSLMMIESLQGRR